MEFRRGTFFSDLIWIYLLEKKKKRERKKDGGVRFLALFIMCIRRATGIRPPLSIRKCRSLPCRPSFPLWDQKEMYVTISMSITHCTTKKEEEMQRRDANWDGGRLVFKRRGTLIYPTAPGITIHSNWSPSLSKKKLGGHLPTFIWCVNDFLYRTKFCKSYTSCNLLLNQVKGNLGDVENVRIYYF